MLSITSASMTSTFWSCSAVRTSPAPLVEPRGERGEMALGQLQPGRRGVAPVGDQPLGAVADGLVQVEARDRSGRTLGELVAEGHDDRRAGGRSRPAGWPRCRSRRDASPSGPGRSRPGPPSPPSARIISCASRRISRSISWRRLLTRSSSSAIEPASAGIVGGQHLHGPHGPLQPAGRVDPGRQAEAHHAGGQPRLVQAAGDLHQGLEPDHRRRGDAVQPVTDDDPVLVDQRDDVGHRRHRDQAQGPDQEVAEMGRGLLAVAEALADLPGELEGDPRAAEVAARIECCRAGEDGPARRRPAARHRSCGGRSRSARCPARVPAAPRPPPRSRNRP